MARQSAFVVNTCPTRDDVAKREEKTYGCKMAEKSSEVDLWPLCMYMHLHIEKHIYIYTHLCI